MQACSKWDFESVAQPKCHILSFDFNFSSYMCAYFPPPTPFLLPIVWSSISSSPPPCSLSPFPSPNRSGPFEISADLEDSMEFVDPSGAGETDESGDEHISDEETDLGTDWENLPSPRFCDIPSQPVEMLQSQSTQASQPIASSSAGGMISSAAASVTSWFKAYTGHR